MSLLIDDFLQERKEHPLIDVRSEGEFAEGHIKGAINIPILNNSERIIVGTTYKQQGQQAAIHEGVRLVGPRLLDIIHETERFADGREILVHCWRGGMRSNNFCQFAGMAGIKSRSLEGGYKAYRKKAVESFQSPFQFILIAGFTGSGKSEVLRELKSQGEQVIDLEMLANHKGSVFGGLMMPAQPTTEQFQNNLFEETLSLDLSKRIWIEDESIAIGNIFLPNDFWKTMKQGGLLMMEVEKSIRVHRLVQEYGHADKEEFLKAMTSITKKLGGQHFIAAREKLMADDMAATIDILLTYYDKAYMNSLTRRSGLIKIKAPWAGRDVASFVGDVIKQI